MNISEPENTPLLSFQPDAGGVVVDLDVLVTSRMLIQANSGGGKSYALRYLLEQTHGRIPQIVFDPEGEFASLRERLAYVLAGVDGDVPAQPLMAPMLCRRLVELGASAVLDLYDLDLDDRALFIKRFLDELMRLPRALWRPLLIVIDEAHMFCPEKGAGSAVSKAAVAGLCTRGRKRGFCAVLATQRIAKLDKDVAAELNNVLIGRTGLDVDVTRAGNTLGFDKERRQSLPYLDPGVFYAFGPAISREVLRVRTGPVSTTHPEPGRIAPPVPPPPDQLRGLIAQLADLPGQADEAAQDLEGAQLRIGELERQIREQSVTPRIETRVERVEVPVLQDGQIERLEQVVQQIAAAGGQLQAIAQEFGATLTKVSPPAPGIDKTENAERRIENRELRIENEQPTTNDEQRTTNNEQRTTNNGPPTTDSSVERLSAPQQRILDALASFAQLGLRQVARHHVAVWSDASPTSSAYSNNLGALRSAGLIDYPAGGQVALTEAGGRRARPTAPIHSIEQLHEAWITRLPGPQGRILRALIGVYPRDMDRVRLATYTDQSPTSSAYGNNLGALRSLGLIDYPQPGRVVATSLLFPALSSN